MAGATNFLGGVADVLHAKGRRGVLSHLADLAAVAVAVYGNDQQLQLVHYRWDRGPEATYTVRVWVREA